VAFLFLEDRERFLYHRQPRGGLQKVRCSRRKKTNPTVSRVTKN